MNRSHAHAHPRRRGFAFTEVLFAVMVLGLGFIMIAAMFPVTISQTQATVQETTAAGIARAAFQALAQCPNLNRLDPTDSTGLKALSQSPFWPIDAAGGPSNSSNVREVWNSLAGNFINDQNPRYGWTVLYRRAANDNVAQVIIIATQNPSGEPYTVGKHVMRPDAARKIEAGLEPKQVFVTNLDRRPEGTEISIRKSAPALASKVEGLVREGAYVVIGDVGSTTLNPSYNGRIFQLGPRINFSIAPTTPMVFKAQAGTELDMNEPAPPSTLGSPGVIAYVVGRNYTDAYSGGAEPIEADFTGNTQEIGVYTGYIQIP
jgi:hypothetical protein